ncbi:site-specific DNA-methyltransferase [Desulfovibrio piger]|nr:site-specific DNA-methyltransferase [Desulfovibrio piger]
MSQHNLPGTSPTKEEKVEDMTFSLPQPEPIKGFPELRWTGKHPFTSTHYYPAQLKERYGDPVDGWMNRIYWGDNLQVMSHLLKEFRGKVDLVYIDPPFDSKADYKKTITLHGKTANSDSTSFEEKQYTDIWSNDEYLQFVYERLILLKELISDNGSIYIHCDYKRSHYIKCISDEILGKNFFQNEIVWKRTTSRAGTASYNHIHDTILFYTKSKNFIWNQQYTEYSEEYIRANFKSDNNNRLFRETPLTAPGLRLGESGKEWRGVNPSLIGKGRHWAIPSFLDKYLSADSKKSTLSALEELYQSNRIVWAKNGEGRPNAIQYIDDLPGVEIQSIWNDFSALSSNALESASYPTQKPEALLERIIKSSSNPGSIVFDCFMGSGTTQAVAMKLGRRFIGADINLGAIQTTTKRLNGIIAEKKQAQHSLLDDGSKLYLNFEVYNVNNYDVFRNPVQARELLLQALEIDPLESTDVFDGMKDGYKVKIMPVNRIATRADLNPLLNGINYRELDRQMELSPGSPAERIMLVCMGHEPDLTASLKMDIGSQYRIDVKVVDILRDRNDLTFKYDSEADIVVEKGELVIRQFYPRNLLQKLSILDENVEDWRQLVETIAIDWNYNGDVLQPAVYDNPSKNELVQGRYVVPEDYGIIRVKITDLLSESLEMTLEGE